MLKGLKQTEDSIRSENNARKEKIRSRRTLYNTQIENGKNEVEKELLRYLDSDEVERFIRYMKDASEENPVDRFWNLGTCMEPFQLPPSVRQKAKNRFGDAYSAEEDILKVPYTSFS